RAAAFCDLRGPEPDDRADHASGRGVPVCRLQHRTRTAGAGNQCRDPLSYLEHHRTAAGGLLPALCHLAAVDTDGELTWHKRSPAACMLPTTCGSSPWPNRSPAGTPP